MAGPTQRTRITERRTTDTSKYTSAVTDLSGLQAGIDAFHTRKLREAEIKRKEQRADDKDSERSREIYRKERLKAHDKLKAEKYTARVEAAKAEVMSTLRLNPEKVHQSQETGDWGWTANVDQALAQSQMWLTAVPQMIGHSAGLKALAGLKQHFADLDPAINGEEEYDRLLAEQTKGMDALTKQAFMSVTDSAIPSVLQDRQTAISKFQNNQILVNAGVELTDNIKSFSGLADFEAWKGAIASSMTGMGNYSSKAMAVEDLAVTKLFQLAHDIGTQDPEVRMAAIKLLTTPDANGKTIEEKHQDLKRRAFAEASAQSVMDSTEGYLGVQFNRKMEDWDQRMDFAQKGKGLDGETPDQVFAKAVAEVDSYGGLKTKRFRAFATNYLQTKVDKATDEAVLAMVVTGRPVDPKEAKKAVTAAYFSDNPEMRKMAMVAMGKYGVIPPSVRQQYEQDLGSSDWRRVIRASREIEGLRQAYSLGLDTLVPDVMSQVMAFALEGADDVDAEYLVKELRAKLKDWQGNVGGAYAQQLQKGSVHGLSAARLGHGGVRDWIQNSIKKHDGFREGLARALGMTEDELGKNLENFSSGLLDRIERTMDVATVLVSLDTPGGGKHIGDAIVGPVLKMLKDDVEYTVTNGQPVVTVRQTPRWMSGPSGKHVEVQPWTNALGKEWVTTQVDTWGKQHKLGFTNDALTRENGSMQMTMDDNGVGQPIIVGQFTGTTVAMADGLLAPLVKSRKDHEDASDVQLYIPGEVGKDGLVVPEVVAISPSVYAQWTGQMWSYRAVSPRTWTAANQAKMAEESAAKLEEMRAAFGRNSAGMLPEEVNTILEDQTQGVPVLNEAYKQIQNDPNLGDAQRNAALSKARSAINTAAMRAATAAREATLEAAKQGQAVEPGVMGMITGALGIQDSIESFEHKTARRRTAEEVRDSALASGMIDPSDADQVLVEGDPAATLSNILKRGQRGGRPIDDVSTHGASPFMNEVTHWLFQREAFNEFAEPDPGKPSQLNIGFGFSLERGDAREILEELGIDYDEVKAGRQPITKGQAHAIARVGVAELGRWLRSHFDGVELSKNQTKALISLAWTSGWEPKPNGKAGPTLITKELTQAIRNKQWVLAADLIAHDEKVLGYNAANSPVIRRGVQRRRWLEAGLFRGAKE